MDIPVDDYKTVSIYEDNDILCYRTARNIWGGEKECILIYSEDLYIGQYKGLLASIEKKRQQLQTLKEQLKNPKSRISRKALDIDARIQKIINGDFGESIFKIDKIGMPVINDMDFSVDYEIMKDLCYKNYGKRLLITDQASWTTEEILEAY